MCVISEGRRRILWPNQPPALQGGHTRRCALYDSLRVGGPLGLTPGWANHREADPWSMAPT